MKRFRVFLSMACGGGSVACVVLGLVLLPGVVLADDEPVVAAAGWCIKCTGTCTAGTPDASGNCGGTCPWVSWCDADWGCNPNVAKTVCSCKVA